MNIYNNKKLLFVFLIPALFFVTTFIFYPAAMNVYYSLFKWSSYSKHLKFVGLSNILKMVKDPFVWAAMKNNILYAIVSLIFQVFGGLVFAHLINIYIGSTRASIMRVIFFIPAIISITAIGLLWMIIYSPSIGFLNPFLEMIGLGRFTTDWLGNKNTAMMSVIMVSQWQYMGEMVMLFTVGLQNVPMEIYDSAKVDGANGVQVFFKITIPMIKENILMNMTITIIGAFMVFDEVYVMTSGGPGRATEVLATLLYKTGFRMDKMGYASSISVLLFIITLLLSLVQIRMFNVKDTMEIQK